MPKAKETVPRKVERTGETTFNVHHDDGSVFECQADSKERLDSIDSKLGCAKKIFQFGGIGKKKDLICDVCNKKVHKITYRDGRGVCPRCT